MSVKNPKPSFQSAIVTSVTSQQILAYSAERTAVTLAAIGSTVFVSKTDPATALTGLPIPSGVVPFTLCQCHGGNWIKGPLYAIAGAGTPTIIVIEGFEPAAAGVTEHGKE